MSAAVGALIALAPGLAFVNETVPLTPLPEAGAGALCAGPSQRLSMSVADGGLAEATGVLTGLIAFHIPAALPFALMMACWTSGLLSRVHGTICQWLNS